MRARSRIGYGVGVAALALVGACGPVERTVLVHEPETTAPSAIWTVDFIREFTVPENYRYRTEEYGSAAADPARHAVYIGSRDGTLLAIDDADGEFLWELDIGGGLAASRSWRASIASAASPTSPVRTSDPTGC